METVMIAIILLVVIPIFFGYLALMTWSFWSLAYVGYIAVLQRLRGQAAILQFEQAAQSNDVWNQLCHLIKIPWLDIKNAIELSGRTKKTGIWLKKLGAQEVDNLNYGKISAYSMSYPDQYDLVTNISDEKLSPNLASLYQNASSFLHKGGLFISIERMKEIHSLNDHILAARSSGLELQERSDRIEDHFSLKVSTKEWLAGLGELRGTMMVWAKV